MPNTSATGGYLRPSASPAPLEGRALLRFVQQVVVGITGMDGTMVRPRYQEEPPNIPDAGEVWAAIGIMSRPSDTFPAVIHSGADGGSDTLQRHERMNVLCSFYDTGQGGEADEMASLLRDGLAIAQNREPLMSAGMALGSVGELTPVPVLLKMRWLYRVDLPFIINRAITRTYAVESLLIANIELDTDVTHGNPEPYQETIIVPPS